MPVTPRWVGSRAAIPAALGLVVTLTVLRFFGYFSADTMFASLRLKAFLIVSGVLALSNLMEILYRDIRQNTINSYSPGLQREYLADWILPPHWCTDHRLLGIVFPGVTAGFGYFIAKTDPALAAYLISSAVVLSGLTGYIVYRDREVKIARQDGMGIEEERAEFFTGNGDEEAIAGIVATPRAIGALGASTQSSRAFRGLPESLQAAITPSADPVVPDRERDERPRDDLRVHCRGCDRRLDCGMDVLGRRLRHSRCGAEFVVTQGDLR